MKLNGNNKVQGLYHHSFAPEGVVYTKGDLVYNNSALYTCLSETSSDPDPGLPEWEYYLNNLSPVKNLEELELISNKDKLVTANAVREYLQKSLPGTNSDGTLKVLAEGNLHDIVINSKYQLDPTYLINLKLEDPTSLPILEPVTDNLYLITTTGVFYNQNYDTVAAYHQEFIEIFPTGKTNFYTRTGSSLQSAPWRSLDQFSTHNEYLEYIDNLIAKNLTQSTLYQNFLDDLSSGEYKIWKSILQEDVILDGSKITFTSSSTPFQTPYSMERHYRIYIGITDAITGAKTKDHIDINPSDHTFLSVGETLSFKRVPGLELSKIQTSTADLIIPANITITGMLESNTFSI